MSDILTVTYKDLGESSANGSVSSLDSTKAIKPAKHEHWLSNFKSSPKQNSGSKNRTKGWVSMFNLISSTATSTRLNTPNTLSSGKKKRYGRRGGAANGNFVSSTQDILSTNTMFSSKTRFMTAEKEKKVCCSVYNLNAMEIVSGGGGSSKKYRYKKLDYDTASSKNSTLVSNTSTSSSSSKTRFSSARRLTLKRQLQGVLDFFKKSSPISGARPLFFRDSAKLVNQSFPKCHKAFPYGVLYHYYKNYPQQKVGTLELGSGVEQSSKNAEWKRSMESNHPMEELAWSEAFDLQHSCFKAIFDENNVTFSNFTSPGPRCLEVNHTTGVWMLEMAESYPECKFYGVDWKPKSLAPTIVKPRNCSFFKVEDPFTPTSVEDSSSSSSSVAIAAAASLSSNNLPNFISSATFWPFPGQYFDFIHHRNILSQIPSLMVGQKNVLAYFAELYRLSAPGCVIECVEPVWFLEQGGELGGWVSQLMAVMMAHLKVDIKAPLLLPFWLKQVGFKKIDVKRIKVPVGSWGGHVGRLSRDLWTSVVQSIWWQGRLEFIPEHVIKAWHEELEAQGSYWIIMVITASK